MCYSVCDMCDCTSGSVHVMCACVYVMCYGVSVYAICDCVNVSLYVMCVSACHIVIVYVCYVLKYVCV